MIFVGNPWSGIASAPELLPTSAGLIGRLLPPGAGGNLLRNTAFFVERAGPGRDHGRSGDAAAHDTGDLKEIEDDSLIDDLRRPPHRSANDLSVVSILPF
jgi:hypothetical protein